MNPQPDMYYQTQHMSAGPAPAPQTVTSGALPQYGHPQPTLLQPGPQYSAPPYHYGYSNGLPSPQTAQPAVSAPMGPGNVLPLPGVANQSAMPNNYQGFDTSGQIAPPGMKPRVTATLWEDEGSLCFQVEARGICVARREDNHMINGTKLLNVAGMTRGRRDGILKSEKVRHVVKIGPMHLKGVWIPFERALDFANKEKITELLYPLFVHNIGALLYHPTNQNRTNQVMAAAERRKQEVSQMRTGPPGPGPAPGPSPPSGVLPSIQQHHHHMGLPGPQPLPSHATSGRPSLDRVHTFPTPPASASSVMGNMGMMPHTDAVPGSQPLPSHASGRPSLDRAHTFPTPPTSASSVMGNMGAGDSYWSQQPMNGGSDVKPPNGMIQHSDGVQHHTGEDEAEHEAEYTHDSGAYDANRNAYNYNAPPVAPMSGDHTHLSSDITGSPGHQGHSGRATPRTTAQSQPYYGQPTGYSTPPRLPPSSSNLYNVVSNDRAGPNGASASDVYGSRPDINPSMQNGYGPPSVLNGVSGPLKRGRDEDEELQRPSSGSLDLKRRKTLVDSSIAPPVYDAMNRPASAVGGPRRR